MSVNTPRQRADLPALVMHWGLVLAVLLSVSAGWRIASLHESSAIWRWVDALLLQGNVVRWHFFSASALAALVAAYVAFLWRMQLGARLAGGRQPGRLRPRQSSFPGLAARIPAAANPR